MAVAVAMKDRMTRSTLVQCTKIIHNLYAATTQSAVPIRILLKFFDVSGPLDILLSNTTFFEWALDESLNDP